jgi:hypothetical protein
MLASGCWHQLVMPVELLYITATLNALQFCSDRGSCKALGVALMLSLAVLVGD